MGVHSSKVPDFTGICSRFLEGMLRPTTPQCLICTVMRWKDHETSCDRMVVSEISTCMHARFSHMDMIRRTRSKLRTSILNVWLHCGTRSDRNIAVLLPTCICVYICVVALAATSNGDCRQYTQMFNQQ